ncbi:MAG: riboflavin synthase [Mariprofundaceae bacterium]|nr:riboflavin synthase [Mariprofundaceae bacterium]
MFTGIIQDVGCIASLTRETAQTHFTIATALDTGAWQLGDSIAVDGCCLTATRLDAGVFDVTLSQETLELTIFDTVSEGQKVNLEPALRMGDALGGHLVSGHIDGIGRLEKMDMAGEHRVMRFSLPAALVRYVVHKGSVAVNGVSLTVNEADDCGFTVNLIPHTLAHSNLGALNVGDQVNIETDLLGRYVERLMDKAEKTTGEKTI